MLDHILATLSVCDHSLVELGELRTQYFHPDCPLSSDFLIGSMSKRCPMRKFCFDESQLLQCRLGCQFLGVYSEVYQVGFGMTSEEWIFVDGPYLLVIIGTLSDGPELVIDDVNDDIEEWAAQVPVFVGYEHYGDWLGVTFNEIQNIVIIKEVLFAQDLEDFGLGIQMVSLRTVVGTLPIY